MLEDFRLRVFLTVAEQGSFTGAARQLGISQPAVSQNVTTLEKLVGTTLFTRAKGDIYLTAEGRAFREYASRILYWYDAADAMFGTEGRMTVNRPVRIAADPVAASYLIPRALAALHAAHPELGFSIEPYVEHETMAESVFEPVEDPAADGIPGKHFGKPQDADVEITVAPSPETMDFEGESRLVGVMDAAVVASPLNRSIAKAAVAEGSKPFSTIAGVHVSNNFAIWQPYVPFLTPDLEARVAIKSASVELIKTLVRSSDRLVGIVPQAAVRDEIAAGTLLQMPVRLPDFAFDIHFNPLPEFAGKTVCQLLQQTLQENLR